MRATCIHRALTYTSDDAESEAAYVESYVGAMFFAEATHDLAIVSMAHQKQ